MYLCTWSLIAQNQNLALVAAWRSGHQVETLGTADPGSIPIRV
jgi:hypothetical protein